MKHVTLRTWLMLHTVMAGKKTSESGVVVEWMVVMTVALRNSSLALYTNTDATKIDVVTI